METLPLDQELEVTLDELARAERAYESSLRAPVDWRMTDPHEHWYSLSRKHLRVLELEAAVARLRRELAA